MNLTDEIRVKCAEAMGWTEIELYEDNQGPPILHGYPPSKLTIGEDGEWDVEKAKNTKPVPRFLSSVDAALTLCDRLRSEGWELTLERPGLRDWIVTFEVPRGRSVESRDPSLARAICLAFLKVKGEAK